MSERLLLRVCQCGPQAPLAWGVWRCLLCCSSRLLIRAPGAAHLRTRQRLCGLASGMACESSPCRRGGFRSRGGFRPSRGVAASSSS